VGPRLCLKAVTKRKIPCTCRESKPSRPARSLVAVPTPLHYVHVCVNAVQISILDMNWSIFIKVGMNSMPQETIPALQFLSSYHKENQHVFCAKF
jgi:hypothetical protein